MTFYHDATRKELSLDKTMENKAEARDGILQMQYALSLV